MICEKAYELMSAKLDGELSAEQDAELTAHLASCPECRRLMQAMQTVEDSVSALHESAPEGLKKGVKYRIDLAVGACKPPKRRWIGPGTVFGAVAALLVLLVGTGVIPLPKQQRSAPVTDVALPALASTNALQEAAGAAEKPDTPDKQPNLAFVTAGTEVANETDYGLPAFLAPAASSAPLGTLEESDEYYRNGEEPVLGVESGKNLQGVKRTEARAVDETSRSLAATRSTQDGALLLLYTEFSPETLFDLLQAEEPTLYERASALQCEEADGLLLYRADCGTVLAIHEWILENLPQSEQMDPESQEAETRLRIRMDTLDPESGSLYRIITWEPRPQPVVWPATWPKDWAIHLRLEENWALFFPTEGYAPSAEKPAILAFLKQ